MFAALLLTQALCFVVVVDVVVADVAADVVVDVVVVDVVVVDVVVDVVVADVVVDVVVADVVVVDVVADVVVLRSPSTGFVHYVPCYHCCFPWNWAFFSFNLVFSMLRITYLITWTA